MLINLKTFAAKAEQYPVKFELQDRLPAHIKLPCVINCRFDVKPYDNYYVIKLNVDSILTVICQRCLSEFSYPYANQTELAICTSDETAEKLMENYECIVSSNSQIDLIEIVTDELYLYGPEFHPEQSDCDNEMSKFINLK